MNIYISAYNHENVQELPEEGSAAERYPYPAEELCRLPEAAKLAVVETLHQSQASTPGTCRAFHSLCPSVRSFFNAFHRICIST